MNTLGAGKKSCVVICVSWRHVIMCSVSLHTDKVQIQLETEIDDGIRRNFIAVCRISQTDVTSLFMS
jgi:hypothetical protein